MEVDDEIIAIYRKRAKELRGVAATMADAAQRKAMLEVALTYEKLADQLVRLRSYGSTGNGA
jgi:hypothetical protein